MIAAPALYERYRTDGGQLGLRYHFHQGQWMAWQAARRFVLVLAGTQGGKTSFGPHWLRREIQLAGPGDYLVVAPTYTLMDRKCGPEYQKLFEDELNLGRYYRSSREFVFSERGMKKLHGQFGRDWHEVGRIMFGYAARPESLESATAKAAHLDEAGQKLFKLASWEAILRRLSLAMGRVLVTTTPYDLGWLKQKLWDPWQAMRQVGRRHDEIDVIRFESIMNPAFPREEFERARRDLPPWKFDLFYRALFTRPAGLIYDSFIDLYAPQGHKVKPFQVPPHWPRYVGIDFGGVNTAALFYASEPGTDHLYLYREYFAGGRTAAEHVRHMSRGEPFITQAVGGAPSERQWRSEMAAGGLEVLRPPISDVEVGINRVYGCHARGEIFVFDNCTGYLKEKETYSRELDEMGEPTEEIEEKSKFHRIDAERYIISHLRQDDAETPRSHSFGRAS